MRARVVDQIHERWEMDRRKFLKYIAGAAAATVGIVAGKYVYDIMSAPSTQEVVVIGAGLSGLTAAYLLTKEGKKVTVIEGCHRVGGRVGTYREWANGQYNDVGGEEIFNCDTDALWLVNELGLSGKMRRFRDYATSFLKGQYTKPITWEKLLDLISWENKNTKSEYLDLLKRVTSLSGPSYTGREPWLYDYLGSNYLNLDEWSLKDWLLEEQGYGEELVWWIDVTMKAEFGTTSDEVSAGEGSDYLYYWWWSYLYHLKGGNDQIITELVNQLPPDTVMVESPVHSVANTANGVEVQYGDDEIITADFAVVAAPHTKALNIVENLPDDKQTAMEKLISTRLVYPFQQYSEKFWQTTDNRWSGDFLLTDLNPSWIVHATALQDEETYGQKGILNHFVNQPEALELWSDDVKEINGFRAVHVEDAEATRITNALLGDMENFWPEVNDFFESGLVYEYEYYGPARPPRYVLDGYYQKNREPFENIYFACDWTFGFGMDAAVASARHAVSQIL